MCNVALLTLVPASLTGSKTAVGVIVPVLPTSTIISIIFVFFFSVSFYLLYREAQTFTQGFSGSIKSLSGENNESIKQ